MMLCVVFFFFQAEDGIRDRDVTGVQTCALPIWLSTRAVPLQAKALEALDRLPMSDNPILFPNMRGGRIDFRIFGRKYWRPAQIKAGIEPVRGLYDLRHTYATFALRAGIPVFAVSRFMGSSIAMI